MARKSGEMMVTHSHSILTLPWGILVCYIFAQVRKTAPVSVLPNYPSWPWLFSPLHFFFFYSGENRALFQHVISIRIGLDSSCQSNHKKKEKNEWGTLKLLQLLSRAWVWTKRTRLTGGGGCCVVGPNRVLGQDLIVKWYEVTGKSVNHSVSSHSHWRTTASLTRL